MWFCSHSRRMATSQASLPLRASSAAPSQRKQSPSRSSAPSATSQLSAPPPLTTPLTTSTPCRSPRPTTACPPTTSPPALSRWRSSSHSSKPSSRWSPPSTPSSPPCWPGTAQEEAAAASASSPTPPWRGRWTWRGGAHALYLCCGAFGTAILHALWRNMPALPFGPDGLLRLPEHPEVVLHRSQLSSTFLDADGADRWTAYQHRRMRHAYRTDAVIINTVEELDPTGLSMVRRALGDGVVPVFPVGPLVRDSDETTKTTHDVLGWLDTQRPASVLYISFGSQNALRPKQMAALADALESTGRPFVWAVRAAGAGAPPYVEWTGFEERARVKNRGLVLRGWAPQVSILAHGSTGGFLSHCGWNSVLESLTRGVPILGWPVSAEQFYNATMLEEVWGVCVEVARGNQLDSPAVESSKLGQAVEAVMGDATTMRRQVLEVQELLKGAWAEDGGSSTAALQGFFKAMRLVSKT
uniref:Uncharacterized protein n=1 Tax=Avena sativa TaxID=4498 RepID=A0ACD5YZ16_AVESA